MDRRRLVALPLALAAGLTFATAVLGGGWATASLDSPPPDPRAGGPVEIDLTVLQHGMTPIDWIGLTVVATNAATGEAVTAAAQPARPLGHYVATLIFPSAGDWSISYQSGDLVMEGTATLSVAAAVAAAVTAPAGSVAENGAVAEAGSIAPGVFLGLVIALLLGGVTILVRQERREPEGERPAPAAG